MNKIMKSKLTVLPVAWWGKFTSNSEKMELAKRIDALKHKSLSRSLEKPTPSWALVLEQKAR